MVRSSDDSNPRYSSEYVKKRRVRNLSAVISPCIFSLGSNPAGREHPRRSFFPGHCSNLPQRSRHELDGQAS
jgi:hypothetical protein